MEVPWLGRRGASAAFLATVTVSIALGAVFSEVALWASMVGTFAAESAFALVYLQSQELFPTTVRVLAHDDMYMHMHMCMYML